MLTDRETELRDAYLKGYDDKTKYNDKLVVDRYELAERYAVNQAKNNEVLDPVSKRDKLIEQAAKLLDEAYESGRSDCSGHAC